MDKKTLYETLVKSIQECKKCDLYKNKTHYVPGEGSLNARIMFIGEGPGREEDMLGRPFVGAAGKFLTELLNKIGLARDDVYIGNIVKCRPPNNRVPLQNEIDACLPYLFAQISIVEPEIIVILGNTPLNALINPNLKISAVHGRFFEKDGYKFFVTFHPAAALYHGEYKMLLEEDFNKLKNELKMIKT